MTKKLYLCKRADRAASICVTAAFLTVCVCLLITPGTSIEGAKDGLNYSFGVLVPSLFPFMFLSHFAVEYGISQRLAPALRGLTEKLFYLPGEAGVTILLSFIGGFPVGASGINSLIKENKITQNQAKRMLCFCVNSGPAFMISVIGIQLYKNVILGVALLISQILASIAVGVFLGILARKKEPIQRSVTTDACVHRDFATSFISACTDACKSTVNLCALVILFSTLTRIISDGFKLSEDSLIYSFVNSLLEVTSGCNALADDRAPLYWVAMAVGWSGISVHFQIFSAANNVRVNKAVFWLFRLINGLVSAAAVYIITRFIKQDSEVFSNITETSTTLSSSTFYGSLALFCASILFLIFIHTYMRASDKKLTQLN